MVAAGLGGDRDAAGEAVRGRSGGDRRWTARGLSRITRARQGRFAHSSAGLAGTTGSSGCTGYAGSAGDAEYARQWGHASYAARAGYARPAGYAAGAAD